jgi:hypothetical protein
VALWAVVHQSEKAKAIAKEVLQRLSGGGAHSGTLLGRDVNRVMDENVVNRARHLIDTLLM